MAFVLALQTPSRQRIVQALALDTSTGTIPVNVGKVVAYQVDLEEHFNLTRQGDRVVRAWLNRPKPRFVTIDDDHQTVFCWPPNWTSCYEPALGSHVRRVGRIIAHQLIFDGHYFLENLGVHVRERKS